MTQSFPDDFLAIIDGSVRRCRSTENEDGSFNIYFIDQPLEQAERRKTLAERLGLVAPTENLV